jgi:hypothetical protein
MWKSIGYDSFIFEVMMIMVMATTDVPVIDDYDDDVHDDD